ncbi:MAG: hypothetical protein ACRYFT_14330 [Janthinobacterium lividum]
MENYTIYLNLKREIQKKKLKLSDLNTKSSEINAEIERLKVAIEEDMNGLSMISDYLILQNDNV